MIRKWILLAFVVLYIGVAYGQKRISGLVMDLEGTPIERANIILMRSQSILTFTTSDEEGVFSIDLPTNKDSLVLELTHLTHDTKRVPLVKDQEFYEIQLLPRSYDLPEISVEVPPVVKRGDTLIFNVEAYKREGDENIEQVLKRIPGVTVSSEGAISYQGLDISKFYVEGLDLMEGRYRQITRNLGLQNIRDIQIIENHQPIRALDSIYKPDNAAINLKLKSKVAVTGNSQAEIALPLNALIATNLFGFTKKQQFSLSGSFNSIGEDKTADFQSFYPNEIRVERDLLRVKKVNRPFQMNTPRVYLDNREFTGGVNYLRKLGEFTQIKLQGSALLDKINFLGSNTSRFFLGDEISTFNEQLNATERPEEFEGRAILEYNGDRVYGKINTQFRALNNQATAQNIINDESTSEAFEKNELELITNADFLISKNKKAYQIKANFQYLEKDYQLDITDAFILAPGINQQFFPELNQLAQTKDLNLSVYTNFYIKKNNLEGIIELRPALSSRAITSVTLDQFNNEEGSIIDEAFQNNHITTRESMSVDQSWTYEKGKLDVRLEVPLSYNLFTIRNELNDTKQNDNFFTYQPELTVTFNLFGESDLQLNYRYFQDFFSFDDLFYDGLLVQSNRSVQSQVNSPNQYRGQEVRLGLGGINGKKTFYYDIDFSVNNRINEQIANNLFDTIGVVGVFSERENESTSYNVNSFIKYTPLGPFDFEFRGSYSREERDQLINDVFTTFFSNLIATAATFNLTLDKQVFTFSPSWDRVLFPQLDQKNDQLKLQFGYYWKLSQQSSIKLDWAGFLFASSQESFWTNILNLTLGYKVPEKKISVQLSLLNLLNQQNFTSYFQGTFSDSITRFRLNPRQVQLGLRKSF